jgi:hypothetical protein
MNNDDPMQSTMQQIEMEDGPPLTDRKGDLEQEISTIEGSIRDAQKEVEQSNSQPYSYAPVSPEQANARLKSIVFLKKDLEKKRLEYDELGAQ